MRTLSFYSQPIKAIASYARSGDSSRCHDRLPPGKSTRTLKMPWEQPLKVVELRGLRGGDIMPDSLRKLLISGLLHFGLNGGSPVYDKKYLIFSFCSPILEKHNRRELF